MEKTLELDSLSDVNLIADSLVNLANEKLVILTKLSYNFDYNTVNSATAEISKYKILATVIRENNLSILKGGGIKISETEMNMITEALNYEFDKRLEIIKKIRKNINKKTIELMLKNAKLFSNLADRLQRV